VLQIGGNTFYNQKNKIPMKIPEFKRSRIGIIAKFREIPCRFPNQRQYQLLIACLNVKDKCTNAKIRTTNHKTIMEHLRLRADWLGDRGDSRMMRWRPSSKNQRRIWR
jgi:hypothetical protein